MIKAVGNTKYQCHPLMIITPFSSGKSGKNSDVPTLLQEPAPTFIVSAPQARRGICPQKLTLPHSPDGSLTTTLYWALEYEKWTCGAPAYLTTSAF